MPKDPWLHDMEEVTEIGDNLEAECAELENVEDDEISGNSKFLGKLASGVNVASYPEPSSICKNIANCPNDFLMSSSSQKAVLERLWQRLRQQRLLLLEQQWLLYQQLLRPPPPPLIGGRRLIDAIVVSAVILLSFVYFYLIGYIDSGDSTAGSSSSLDFRDNYISIILFRAAYVWIKFRDVISLSKGAIYHRRGSSKWEPRIKYPGGTGQRLPLCSYDSSEKAEVVYRIAAFYCNKPENRLGRLNLGGGDYFLIPTFNVDPSLPYKGKVKQVRDQVLKVYAEFEEQKTSRNLSPHILGQALETSTEGDQCLTTPPIQQPQEPLNSGMDLTTQGQGSQHAPNTCNGVDFDNPSSVRHELLEVYKEIDSLKAQLSRKDDQINELKQRHSELEGLLEQSRLRELDFDPDTVFDLIEA